MFDFQSPSTRRPGRLGRQGRRDGVQSVEIAARVLITLGRRRVPTTLTELSHLTALSPSRLFHYLASLVRTGLVSRDSSSGRYGLGGNACALGISALSQQDSLAVAYRELGALVETTGWLGLVSVHGPHGPTVVRVNPGRLLQVTAVSVGTVLPWDRSATGLVLTAFGSRPDSSQRRTGSGSEARLRKIARQGYAFVSGAYIPGLFAIAVPVRNAQGLAVAALTIVINDRKRRSPPPDVVRAARRASERASGALGFVPDARLSRQLE